MEKRPYSKSLRGKITNRTLFIGIIPVLLVGAFSWFSLNQLTSTANQQLDKSRSELLDSVVGNNLSTTSARIVNELDAFMLERISDVVVWASAPIIVQASKAAAETHEKVGLVGQSIDEIEARFKTRKSLNVSPAANRYLIQQIRRSAHFGEVFFTDKNGFNTALTNPTSDFVQSDENWWKTAWENEISVGEVEYDDSAGIWSVDISVRIDDPTSGRSLGVMKAVLGVSLIQEVADNGARDIAGGSVSVISSGGLLLAETATKHDKKRIMVDSINIRNSTDVAIQEVFSTRRKGYAIGENDVIGYAKSAGPELYRTVVSRFPGFNWTVIVQQPKSIALAPIEGLSSVQASLQSSKQQMIIILVLVVIVVFALAIFVAGMLSKTITQPLLDLRELADSVSKGDTSRTITVNSDDEIQDVAQAFERMRTSVSIIMKRMKEMKAKAA
ncbi:MAG: cache and HAMP domain-containing protein [Gammaproteobacteria bacterium]|nr:cache and HAMP domain-containing protein [Gammaproteobacteria bacterium]MDH3447646.1 cache and HAMP domain-containing protein [Gammaproteobacteria bacterium]